MHGNLNNCETKTIQGVQSTEVFNVTGFTVFVKVLSNNYLYNQLKFYQSH